MLSGFPASAATDVDLQIRAYLMAVDGIADKAIERAAGLFIQGKVKDQNTNFAPSCASFAEQCRVQQALIAAERRPRLEKPEPKEDTSPRVDPRKLQLLQKALKGHQPSRRKLRQMYPHIDIPDAPQEGASE